ncbi:uncharacterized protein LOC134279110 [Saccostrea cucullata]|uniref:uncharacterized protein LOC134279110 n=1 Tax=Saccostrea cuccullata TaxID=36930 RepID=UPI002ED5794D
MHRNCIFVLLIFITNKGTLLSEKIRSHVSKDLTCNQDSHAVIRHGEKRRILGSEHEYFQSYYAKKGLLPVYNRLRHDGLIDDWGPLGATSYSDAIARSTDYYRLQAESGQNVDAPIKLIEEILAYRRQDARKHGGGDRGHNANIDNWQNGLERIQGGQDRFRNWYRTNVRRNRRHRNSRSRREGGVRRLRHSRSRREGGVRRLRHSRSRREGGVRRHRHSRSRREGGVRRHRHSRSRREGRVRRIRHSRSRREGGVRESVGKATEEEGVDFFRAVDEVKDDLLLYVENIFKIHIKFFTIVGRKTITYEKQIL